MYLQYSIHIVCLCLIGHFASAQTQTKTKHCPGFVAEEICMYFSEIVWVREFQFGF